ncbi:MAG TPA: hypothetical protein VMN37_10185 [Gemmatimonadales bacterium]|nr:hypothetical protein [Gemmatimonadales bacterium]
MYSLLLLTLLSGAPAESLAVRSVEALPPPQIAGTLGEPALRFAGGRVAVWLVRAGDTVGLYVAIRDSTESPGDELVVSLDVAGDAAATPQHDDFQWRLRRMLDSSVVSRGRGGRWAPPLDDPEWRLGAEHGGGGWEVEAAPTPDGWAVLLRLHPAWLAGEGGRRPAMAFRVYDGGPGGWYTWPPPRRGAHPTEVERAPSRWIPVGSGD